MKTCKNCKYWSDNYNITNNVADCGKPNFDFDKKIQTQFYIKATASDDQGLEATLFTSGDFGCVLHTLKTK